jgi:hypothetical protein
VEETGTFQNALSSFGGRMINLFHFSGRQFTALLGLDLLGSPQRKSPVRLMTDSLLGKLGITRFCVGFIP